MEKNNAWDKYPEEKREGLLQFAEHYRQFISGCKTERECVAKFEKMAQNAGFSDMEEIIKADGTLKPGDKVYAVNKGKSMALYIIGQEPLEKA